MQPSMASRTVLFPCAVFCLFTLAYVLALSPLCPSFFTSLAFWRNQQEIPGGSGLEHCRDPWDPALDRYRITRLDINPLPPVLGRNVTITTFGHFTSNVTSAATSTYFFDADHAGLVGYGTEDFCTYTTAVQTIDGLTRPICPPQRGFALLRTDILVPEWMPGGDWHVHVDARDGHTGEDPRLFCIEGNVQVDRS